MTKHNALLLTCALALSSAGCVAELGRPNPGSSAYGAERREGVFGVDVSVWSGTITDAEMDCFWDEGVRHVIVGMQDYRIARQQLEMATARGMTVDGYVYLMWDRSPRQQVENAIAFLREHPIGMLWIDVEEAPAGRGQRELEALVEEALAACGETPCGIYTAAWWWTPHMAGSRAFADVPVWYALYDGNPSLTTWPLDAFGGWAEPWGKQYAGDLDLCGVDVDLNTIAVTTLPSVAHPAPRAAPPGVPAQPTGLDPDGATVPTWQDVRVLCAAVPGATGYELAIEHWTGSRFAPYVTYPSTTNARSFSPVYDNRTYRFRVRASNASGWSTWSRWARFDYGRVSAPPPPEAPAPVEPPPPLPEEPPPPSEEPPPPEEPPTPVEPPTTGSDVLSPADGARITTDSVTLSRSPVAGATRYEFEIEYWSGSAYRSYYTYAGSSPSRTFWPAYDDTSYRWRVRAASGAWSTHVTFFFGAAEPPVAPPPPEEPPPPSEEPPHAAGAPTGLSPNGVRISTPSVTLRFDPIAGATRYELAIEVLASGAWGSYYTYTSTSSSKTFYPATHGTSYRWRARAETTSGWGAYSGYAQFAFD